MKRIVFVCDGKNFSPEAFRFVASLYEQEPFLLIGAFFHSFNYALLIPSTFAPDAGPYMSYAKEEREAFKEGIKEFRQQCEKANVEYRVHEESDEWNLSDLVKETRFADLLVVGSSAFFSDITKSEAKALLQQTLHQSECPVMVIPAKAQPVDEVIVAYDGKKDCLYALKQFTYLFPHLCELETTIVYFNNDPEKEIPDLQYIEEFAARHFKLLTFEKVSLAGKYASQWIQEHQNALLVTGAYNRSGLSMTFAKSFGENILNSHTVPLFISHM